jgi:HK97 family phage prohead protease
MEIKRTVPLMDYEIERSGDGRTVTAYAAAFGSAYEVRDHEGHYDELINSAAFNKVLARAGAIDNVQVHYNHGLTLWGTPSDRYSMPIGTPLEIKPDGRGLLTRTKYAKTELGDEILELWRSGAIRGQSFRGSVYQSVTRTRTGPNGRPVIERMSLGLREYGPTPSPTNADAGLVAIRSQLLTQVGEMTPEERRELIALLAEVEDLSTPPDPHAVPVVDPGDTPPVVTPDPGLSIPILIAEAEAAQRRRRAT